ncbi:unnamed protein product, partial [Vitis vinifera]
MQTSEEHQSSGGIHRLYHQPVQELQPYCLWSQFLESPSKGWSLQPKVVTLVEQESNTNTSAFLPRFVETLDYYTAMFESIDVARPRNDKQRINAEQHCVARDIVNIIACEGAERVERHELLGKWRSRFLMAGFNPYPLSSSVSLAIKDMLKEYSPNFWLQERNGALYLGWKNRILATSCAWVLRLDP